MKKLVISVIMLISAYSVLFVVISNISMIDGALEFLLEEVPFVGIIANMADTLAEMDYSISVISTSAFYEDLFKTMLILLYFKINWMIINFIISIIAGERRTAEDRAFYNINTLGWKCALLIVVTAIVSRYADVLFDFLYTSLGNIGTYIVLFVISAVVVIFSAMLSKACDRKTSFKVSFAAVLINQVLKSILDGFATIVFCALIYLLNIHGYIGGTILAIFGYIAVMALIEEVCRRLLSGSVDKY